MAILTIDCIYKIRCYIYMYVRPTDVYIIAIYLPYITDKLVALQDI